MKKTILLLATWLTAGLASQASAVLLSEVEALDGLFAVTTISQADEGEWINAMLGTNFTQTDIDGLKNDNPVFDQVYDNSSGSLVEVVGEYAYFLPTSDGYFLVKTGNGGGGGAYSHWLFENGPNTAWATILIDGSYDIVNEITNFDANLMTYDSTIKSGVIFNISNISSISHIVRSGDTPVPEPATMLLFGAGLVGLAGARARRKKK